MYDFVSFKFNNIPKDRVFELLHNIVLKENINLSETDIRNIQILYNSDIRSMINCIQTFQYVAITELSIITTDLLETIFMMITNKEPIQNIVSVIMSTTHDPKDVIYNMFNYIIRKRPEKVTLVVVEVMKTALHFQDCPLICFINYVITQLTSKI